MKRGGYSLGGIKVFDSVCINLDRRKDRRKKMNKQAKKKNMTFRWFSAVDDREHPNIGKFKSHIEIIKAARRWKKQCVLILEDDAKVLTPRLSIPVPPDEWDMLYLGGNIQKVLADDETDTSETWKRACCLFTHAYVVHERVYGLILREAKKALKRHRKSPETLHLDSFYCNTIHPQVHTYCCTPDRVIQYTGFSDVQGKKLSYDQQLTANGHADADEERAPPQALDKPPMERQVDEETGQEFLQYVMPQMGELTDEDLPHIALVTSLHDQPDLFQAMQLGYYQFNYPREKMLWIIADDSANEFKVAPLIDGADETIKYIRCDMDRNTFLPVSRKHNLCMKYLAEETKFVLHFAPECYYHPDSVRQRVLTMMANPEKQCFGCTNYGVYDLSRDESYEQFLPDGKGNPTLLFTPTLSYTREFWWKRHFDETQYTLESFFFIRYRWEQVLDIPYQMVMIALTWDGHRVGDASRYGLSHKGRVSTSSHHTSIAKVGEKSGDALTDATKSARRVAIAQSFPDQWDMKTKNVMLMLKGLLPE